MKKYFLLMLFASLFFTLKAQAPAAVQELIDKGNSVFIEVIDKKENTTGVYDAFILHLRGDEWSRWRIVESVDQADYICRLHVEKKGMNPMSFTSMGARIRTVVEILTPDGKSVWKSKQQQGNAGIYTDFDAVSDAMRKVIRRSLKEEMYGEKE